MENPLQARLKKRKPHCAAFCIMSPYFEGLWPDGGGAQPNCSSSVEPVSAFTDDEPPWITVVTSSK